MIHQQVFLARAPKIFRSKIFIRKEIYRHENKRNFSPCFISPLSLKNPQLKSQKKEKKHISG
jgi:hypothetical protein